jgi:molecular chaperone GrpE (heat shock protein)
MTRFRAALHILIHGELPPEEATIEAVPLPKPASQAPDPPQAQEQVSEPARQPLAVALQLIALRDMVQLTAEQAELAGAAPLASVARRLRDVLAGEQVTSFEDKGGFDPVRHRVVDTVITEDPYRDYQLAGSVRPGYLYAGELLRQQDVIVYRLDAETSRANHG